MVFNYLCVCVLWTKASALEGLNRSSCIYCITFNGYSSSHKQRCLLPITDISDIRQGAHALCLGQAADGVVAKHLLLAFHSRRRKPHSYNLSHISHHENFE